MIKTIPLIYWPLNSRHFFSENPVMRENQLSVLIRLGCLSSILCVKTDAVKVVAVTAEKRVQAAVREVVVLENTRLLPTNIQPQHQVAVSANVFFVIETSLSRKLDFHELFSSQAKKEKKQADRRG